MGALEGVSASIPASAVIPAFVSIPASTSIPASASVVGTSSAGKFAGKGEAEIRFAGKIAVDGKAGATEEIRFAAGKEAGKDPREEEEEIIFAGKEAQAEILLRAELAAGKKGSEE